MTNSPVFASLRVFALFGASFLGAASIAPPARLRAAPPQAGEIERYKSDGSYAERLEFQKALGNDQYAPELIDRAKAKIQRASLEAQGVPRAKIDQMAPLPPPAWRGMPTTGVNKIPAVLIEFSDMQPAAVNTQAYVHNALFGAGVPSEAPYESLTAYYKRASFDKLTIQGNTLGWYRTAYPRSAVSTTTTGRQNLIKEALNSYNASGHDFAQYDNDNDGEIDFLLVIYAGDDNGWGNFWWAYQTSWWNDNFTIDGKRIGTYVFQFTDYDHTGPFRPLVVIHETGHALGLPDLYDYDDTVGPDGGAGGLDMMDGNRGDHNGFHKWLLDWSTPQVVGGASIDRTFGPASTTGHGAVVMNGAKDGEPFDEFFFVENRSPAPGGNDSGSDWPGYGLMIWHVNSTLDASRNDFQFDNSYTSHKFMRVMEADGLEEIEGLNGGWAGDSGDFWNLSQEFGPTSIPSSARYDGSSTGIKVQVTNYGAGNSLDASITVPNSPPTVAPIAARTIECKGGTNLVTLATLVQDPDGDLLDVRWYVNGSLWDVRLDLPSGTTATFQHDFPHGVSDVVVEVDDGHNSTRQQATTVTVQDTTDPVITIAPSQMISTDAGKAFAKTNRLKPPQVNDACDGSPTLSNDSPATLPIGSHTVRWTVVDFSGNVSTASQRVIVADKERPKIKTPAPTKVTRFVNRGEIYSTYRLPRPTFVDNSGKPVKVTSDEPARYRIGKTTVTWTATDQAGNTTKTKSEMTVVNRRPTASAGNDRVLYVNSESGITLKVSGEASSDPDGHTLKFLWRAPRGVTVFRPRSKAAAIALPLGRTRITLTVTDEAGLSHTDVRYVTVRLKRGGARRALGAEANRSFAGASSAALDDVRDGSASEATLNGYRYAATAEGYGSAVGEFVRWEEGQTESDATMSYLELRSFQALYGEQAMNSLIRAYAETGDEAALIGALQAVRGVQAARGDLIAP